MSASSPSQTTRTASMCKCRPKQVMHPTFHRLTSLPFPTASMLPITLLVVLSGRHGGLSLPVSNLAASLVNLRETDNLLFLPPD